MNPFQVRLRSMVARLAVLQKNELRALGGLRHVLRRDNANWAMKFPAVFVLGDMRAPGPPDCSRSLGPGAPSLGRGNTHGARPSGRGGSFNVTPGSMLLGGTEWTTYRNLARVTFLQHSTGAL